MEQTRERNGKKAKGRSTGESTRLLRACLIGAGGGLALSLLLLLLCTAVALGREDPATLLPVLGKLPWIFGGAFSGFLASILLRERNFLCPLLAGAAYLFCVFLLSLGLDDGSVPHGFLSFLLCAAVILALSILAALPVMPGRQKKNANVRRRAKQMRRSYR